MRSHLRVTPRGALGDISARDKEITSTRATTSGEADEREWSFRSFKLMCESLELIEDRSSNLIRLAVIKAERPSRAEIIR